MSKLKLEVYAGIEPFVKNGRSGFILTKYKHFEKRTEMKFFFFKSEKEAFEYADDNGIKVKE